MKRIHKPDNKTYDSKFEEQFHAIWNSHSTYPIVHHHTVRTPTLNPRYPVRKWELDFAFPQEKIGIELQGFGPGHTSYMGMKRDYQKHNDLLLSNWITLYFVSADLDEPTTTVETIIRVLEVRNRRAREYCTQTPGKSKSDPLADAARRLLNKRFDR